MKTVSMQRLIPVILSALLSLLSYSCSGPAEKQSAGSKGGRIELPPAGDNPLGREVYVAKCKLCHGIDGQMGATGAANLAISLLSEEEALDVIANGRNTMRSFSAELSEEQLVAVARYIQAFKE